MSLSQSGGRDDDDILDDLPPMDGDDGDDEDETRGTFDETDFAPLDAVESAEDDGQADVELPIGELIDALPDAAEPDDAELPAIETGDVNLGFADENPERPADDDESGIAGDDLSIGIAETKDFGEKDAEQLGVGEPIEDEVDESEFPELDSDEEADLPDGIDVGELDLPEEAPMPAWSDAPWERDVTPLVAVPMRAVVVIEDRVMAAGDSAVRLAPDGQGSLLCTWLALEHGTDTEVQALALDARHIDRWLIATRHAVLVSNDGGRTVRPRPLPRALALGSILHTLVSSENLAYASTTAGDLFVSADRGDTWREMDGIGTVRALATDERGTAHVVALQGEDVLWLRGDEAGRWSSTLLELDAIGDDARGATLLAARGDTVVLANDRGTIAVSRDAGGSWARLRVPPQLVAVTLLPSGELVAALYLESEDKSILVRVDAENGLACVADLSPNVAVEGDVDPSEGMGQACALAWDDGRGCLWVAGRFGLAAWRVRLPT